MLTSILIALGVESLALTIALAFCRMGKDDTGRVL
jgi:multisubunit Na+/H+ antiporter MnhC subunit